MRFATPLFTLFTLPADAQPPVQETPSKLPFSKARIAALDRHTVVVLRDGSIFRGQIWKADKVTGELRFYGKPERKVACADVETITAEPFDQSYAREGLATAMGLSAFFGGLVLASRSSYPGLAVSAASPLVGRWGSKKAAPRKPRTFAIACPQ